MFKRALWLGIGIAVGVVVVRKIARGAEAFTPGGIAGRVRETAVTIGDSARSFASDIADGMRLKEAELQAALERGESIEPLLHDDDEEDEQEPFVVGPHGEIREYGEGGTTR